MKVLALLSLLGLVAADSHLLMPYSSVPLVTPTFGTLENTPLINTYTASYPYNGFASIQAALPTTYRYPFLTSPILTTGNIPSTIVSNRQKRSADPEPEADPSLLYTTNTGNQWALPTTMQYTIPTTTNFGYTGLPAAVTTYSYPQQTIPTTGITYTTPITGITNTGSFPIASPYSSFTFGVPVVTATGAVRTPKALNAPKPIENSRTKRSADPEADPQLLTTGFTGFTYPAINTRTTGNAITYTGLPLASTAMTYSTLPRTNWPTTYTSGLPITYGTYPYGTTFIGGN